MPPFLSFVLIVSTVLGAAASNTTSASSRPQFSTSQLTKIRENMLNASTKAWEVGTMLEALTELDTPELSVFGATSVPVNNTSGLSLSDDAMTTLDNVLAARAQHAGLKAFFSGGSSGDSASVGVADIVAGITTGDNKYADAAADQLDWLLHDVPRYTDNTTISHRQSEFQAWADFISMVPPFFAYYAAASGVNDSDYGASLMSLAYEQLKGYRDLLHDNTTGLWRHVEEGSWSDPGLWCTGNGWAALGMLRVEETISKSQYGDNMQSEVADILVWVDDILNATWSRQEADGLVKNYMDQDTFEDAAGTAIVTVATYRFASITKNDGYISNAERAFQKLIDLVDTDGWLQSVVNPNSFGEEGEHSPEAQSFLIMLHSASQDYYSWVDSLATLLANTLKKVLLD